MVEHAREYDMKIIDISMDIDPNIQVYKNKEEKIPVFTLESTHKENSFHESKIEMNMHTGTHMDAPLHMIEGGKRIKDTVLEKLITPCKVFDFTNVSGGITKEDLETREIEEKDFVLLKTKNSLTEEFIYDFIYLEKSGAEYLKNKKIKGVGIDALGIERDQPDHETHKILLGNDIPILEGLRLKGVPEGEYVLLALPIKIPEAEGAPVRAVLLEKGFEFKDLFKIEKHK